jgi:hypothetical protein
MHMRSLATMTGKRLGNMFRVDKKIHSMVCYNKYDTILGGAKSGCSESWPRSKMRALEEYWERTGPYQS